jgi:rare lipoprotein A
MHLDNNASGSNQRKGGCERTENKGGDGEENLLGPRRHICWKKGDRLLRKRLRIFGLLVVASLLWTSPMSAATTNTKAHFAVKSFKLSYIGTASWYGEKHQGRKMANGKLFDRRKLTAASWYFPLGTTIRVVNLKNGESVVVTITDRGPGMHLHRLIDLSEAAAERLDYVGQGLTSVFISPLASFSTTPAALDSHLVEPSTLKAAGYETTAVHTPM